MYTDSEFWAAQRPLYVAAGVGAAIRPLGVLRLIGRTPHAFDIDLGARFGPGLTFLRNPTRLQKNQQFRLFLDPFLRTSAYAPGRRVGYLELGTRRPVVRLGLRIPL